MKALPSEKSCESTFTLQTMKTPLQFTLTRSSEAEH